MRRYNIEDYDEFFRHKSSDRIQEIFSKIILIKPEYLKKIDEICLLQKQLLNIFPKEYNTILNKYFDNCSEIQSIAENIIYNQGFKDGMQMLLR